ncbi:MAG: cysteine--tRNA ligase [Patescibacteria group bacterium]
MALTLFNTLGRNLQIFRPRHGKQVTLYTCGPTVYRSPHIGNYRTFIFEDILERTLRAQNYTVKRVMNITDVGHLTDDADAGEDKIEQESKKTHRSAQEIAKFYTKELLGDLKALNILTPRYLPRATSHVKEQIALIKTLEKKGFTYKTADGIYFDTSKFPSYGALAKRAASNIRAGVRVALGEKKHPTDFALWKFSGARKRQMEWKSPWGTGFPGWHIECSAMAMKYLGKTLDIHCGGIDHKETHHPNEIAQSEAATGKPFARFWMHGAFLNIKGEKMAKSNPETNITLQTLRERGFDPLDLRYLVLGTHYRKPLSFSWEALAGARTARLQTLVKPYRALPKKTPLKLLSKEKKAKSIIMEAMRNDLNTAVALREIIKHAFVSKDFIDWADALLGLNTKKEARALVGTTPPDILKKAILRSDARKAKDWKESDRIREELRSFGFEVRDVTPDKQGEPDFEIHRL